MRLLNEISIKGQREHSAVIQLLQGDLSEIPAEHATDILIISAYPGSYVPVPKTLIAALENKGLSVTAMAKNKLIDLRDQLGCWLSQPLSAEQQKQFNFKQLLCFEPWQQSADQTAVIGNIFRCINTFAFSQQNNVIAMPVLASGKQKVPFEKMLPALLDTSIFWMENGLPLNCIKLVLYSDEQAAIALPIFIRAKQQNDVKQSLRVGDISGTEALQLLKTGKKDQLPGEASMQIVDAEIHEMAGQPAAGAEPPSRSPEQAPEMGDSHFASIAGPETMGAPNPPAAVEQPVVAASNNGQQYDFFVSYAHTHTQVVEAFVNNLSAVSKDLRIFYDKSTIPPGGLWIKQISDAIQKARKVIIFLSPDYSNSPVCWDEFQCAKLVEYNSKKQLIQTIYLYNDIAMPPIMGIYSWADGREGDKEKLQKIAEEFCAACG